MGALVLNRILVLTLTGLDLREMSGCVSIQLGKARRAIHVERGHLVGAESNFKAERLGDMLVSDGVLESERLEPAATQATWQGILLGQHLVNEGLLNGNQLSNAIDRQVSFRLGAALSMRGVVTLEEPKPRKATLTVPMPLTMAVVAAFRLWVPLSAIEEHLRMSADEVPARALPGDAVERLELGPAEARIARRLLAGEHHDAIIGQGAPREPVLRLAGALRAVGLSF